MFDEEHSKLTILKNDLVLPVLIKVAIFYRSYDLFNLTDYGKSFEKYSKKDFVLFEWLLEYG